MFYYSGLDFSLGARLVHYMSVCLIFPVMARYLLITWQVLLSWQRFSNSLYKLFLFYIIVTLLAKLRNVSKSLHCHITITKFYSHSLNENLIKFIFPIYNFSEYNFSVNITSFINNFGCCVFDCLLYFAVKDKSFRFFLYTSGSRVFLRPAKTNFSLNFLEFSHVFIFLVQPISI